MKFDLISWNTKVEKRCQRADIEAHRVKNELPEKYRYILRTKILSTCTSVANIASGSHIGWGVSNTHKSDVTWGVRRLISPATRLFVQVNQSYGKETTKVAQLVFCAGNTSVTGRGVTIRVPHNTMRISTRIYPDNKVHGANMGSHVGLMNFAIWVSEVRCQGTSWVAWKWTTLTQL